MKHNKPNKLDLEATKTVNYEGGEAFKLSPKAELYQRVCTCLLEPKFYDASGKDTVNAILSLIEQMEKIDPEFVLKLASYARNEMYLRTVPIMLLVEACKHKNMKSFVKAYTPSIIRRADELTEAVAYYISRNKMIGDAEKTGMLCNPLKKGLALSFHRFKEYHLGKYNRKGAVTLKDVIRIVHPKPLSQEESELWKKLVEDRLATPETWETFISANGSTQATWETVMPKMPIMAIIRNLRNFCKVKANVSEVVKKLTNPEIIKKSKQFPYRFYSAYVALEKAGLFTVVPLLEALEGSIRLSVDNIPHINGMTFLIADNSGSMDRPISDKSMIRRRDVANLLQSIAHTICDESITSCFGENFAIVPVTKNSTIFDNMKKFTSANVGHSTNGYLAIEWLLKNKQFVDRVIMFSDEQLWDSKRSFLWGSHRNSEHNSIATLWHKYKSTINKNAIFYCIDLAGYGTVVIPERDVYLIAGWSDNILKFINLNEAGGINSIDTINNYNINDSEKK